MWIVICQMCETLTLSANRFHDFYTAAVKLRRSLVRTLVYCLRPMSPLCCDQPETRPGLLRPR